MSAAHRTERLLNLVIALLATRRWLTKEQIRRAVPQYAQCEGSEAFDRMFERDKEDLRELGVPLVTGSDSAWFDDEVGYRIDREDYALPEVELTAEELAVLGLASRVWQQASLAGPAARAMVKLRALGVITDEESLVGVEPRVRAAEPSFDPIYAATRDRIRITFTYRKPDGQAAVRTIEPWAVTSRSGHWYVVGRDVDRDAARVFRLSRVEGAVRRIGRPDAYWIPADLDAGALVASGRQPRDGRTALLRVRPGRGALLRLQALEAPGDPGEDGRQELRVTVGDVAVLAEEIAGHGPDVVVAAPADLRSAVLRLLRGAAGVGEPVRAQVGGR